MSERESAPHRSSFHWPVATGHWPLLILFALSLLLGLGAIVWITGVTLRLDRSEAEIRRQAALEENVRLALWRMDTALAPLLAQVNARPPEAYSPRIDTVLNADGPFPAHLYFQIDSQGRWSSPQVGKTLTYDAFAAALQAQVHSADPRAIVSLPPRGDIAFPLTPPSVEMAQQAQNARGNAEFQRRSQYVAQNSIDFNQSQTAVRQFDGPTVTMTPVWVGGELFLARQVSSPRGDWIEGCWFDWPALQTWLLDTSRDLLPAARLEAVEHVPAEGEARMLAALPMRLVPGQARMLAALPVRLVPGEVTMPVVTAWSPLRLSLAVAWLCVLLAVGSTAALLFGLWSLSERRAAFVSAVTHELRTPLTTFRLYTEMLGQGMVVDETRQREYLHTLQVEADRLSHLVENILAYARLERGHPQSRCETLLVRQMVERITPRLSDRARQGGMELIVEISPSAADATVDADASAVEQILFNLTDNACKYAVGSTDRRIHLDVEAAGGRVVFRVRDHGPGLDRVALRRLFRPFNKSAHEAAHSAPGVGLGLALSHRYAQAMGGELSLERRDDGACFALSLVRVTAT